MLSGWLGVGARKGSRKRLHGVQYERLGNIIWHLGVSSAAMFCDLVQ